MGNFTAEEYDVLATELQLAIDDSIFIGEAYVSEEVSETIDVILTGEIINEPGACGIYPFYVGKHWLIEKAREFVENALDAIFENWECSGTPYVSSVAPYNVKDDGECSLIVTFAFD